MLLVAVALPNEVVYDAPLVSLVDIKVKLLLTDVLLGVGLLVPVVLLNKGMPKRLPVVLVDVRGVMPPSVERLAPAELR